MTWPEPTLGAKVGMGGHLYQAAWMKGGKGGSTEDSWGLLQKEGGKDAGQTKQQVDTVEALISVVHPPPSPVSFLPLPFHSIGQN